MTYWRKLLEDKQCMLVFVELVADLLARCALPFRAKSTELKSVRAAAQDQLEASWSRLSPQRSRAQQGHPRLALRHPSASRSERTLSGREKPDLQHDEPADLRTSRRHPHCRVGL